MRHEKLSEAYECALRWHERQRRKGTAIPYISHLMQVSGLVLEAGGDEDQAIAGFLHDAVEDADTVEEAHARQEEIERRFGSRVLRLVLGCTDGDPEEKEELRWRARKERYLRHLRDAGDDVALVSICDKIHNARSILHDLRNEGPSLWDRFNAGKSGSLWYYRELARTYDAKPGLPYREDFDRLVRSIERESERGSRRHLLDWLGSPRFLPRMNRLLEQTGARVTDSDTWRPSGWLDHSEPKLHEWGKEVLPGAVNWDELLSWWLQHPKGANVPNWDWASTCEIDGEPGLVLVEAKAHANELKPGGKGPPDAESRGSLENHERIGQAIAEARNALEVEMPGIAISRDRDYQLSNRVAHAWWLANHGLPVVLLYLGFLEAGDVADIGEVFSDAAEWRRVLLDHAAGVVPEDGFERWIPCGTGRFIVAVRSVPRDWRQTER